MGNKRKLWIFALIAIVIVNGIVALWGTEGGAQADLVREKIIICAVFDALVLLLVLRLPKLLEIPRDIIRSADMIFDLGVNDFKTQYAGSALGTFWAFARPFITILLYWFVFEVGLGSQPVNGKPFVLWLVAGLIPWLFFQDAVMAGTTSLMEYSYLVKKVVFNISILPAVKVFSASIVHLVSLGIVAVLFWALGFWPGLWLLQVLYYSICTMLLSLGLVYLTSAIVLFFKDLNQLVAIALQVGTWMTPIMWNGNRITGWLHVVLKLNPMYYVVQGYRDSLLDGVFFLNRLGDTAYFWLFVLLLYMISIHVFQKLKPHFADVL